MGDLQGLMVFICILSKHGASHQDNTNRSAEAADTIITFILAFFNFRISIKTVFPSGLHFSTNILHFLPEIGRRSAMFCLWHQELTGLGRFFFLSRHSQSSSPPHLPRVFPRQNWFIRVLIK